MDTTQPTLLGNQVQHAVQNYLNALDTDDISRLYEIFLHELEKPLLTTVLAYTNNNQSRSAQILGLNRGTLRTKLKTHGLLWYIFYMLHLMLHALGGFLFI